MKSVIMQSICIAWVIGILSPRCVDAEITSEFDEAAIRATQELLGASPLPQAWSNAFDAFASATDSTVKFAKYEELVFAASQGVLEAAWPEPIGGWKLLEWPVSGKLSREEVISQQGNKAYYTKRIVQNEADAVCFRSAQGLISSAARGGEQWGEKLLLDIAQRPDSNLKRLTYWFTKDFSEDWHAQGEQADGAPTWPVNWNAWEQAYNAANPLGKAIILRNITMLAVRRNEFASAAAIHIAALSGNDRDLKAIALAFGDPTLGPAVKARWTEIANDTSDAKLQALAREVRERFLISD